MQKSLPAAALILLSLASACASQPAPGPNGIWVVPDSQVEAANARSKALGKNVSWMHPEPFAVDNDSMTLHLFREKEWMWRTADDHYRVKTKWVGNDLYWLPPFGSWTKCATFRDDHFEQNASDGVVWRYEKVLPGDGGEELLPLIKKREMHDYSIQATDRTTGKTSPPAPALAPSH